MVVCIFDKCNKKIASISFFGYALTVAKSGAVLIVIEEAICTF
jgi:hypothetical protein